MTRIVEPIFNKVFQQHPDAQLPILGNAKKMVYRPFINVQRIPKGKDLRFNVDEMKSSFPEGFVIDDTPVGRTRQLMFAKQLERTMRLYFDGTFKHVDEPSKQLFSVHAFIRY